MDEQLYLLAVGLSLEEKIEKAILTLKNFESKALEFDPVNGYYLCDSYGKDSCVILDLAKRSGVKFQAHHNLTTLDPPELILFGRKEHPETLVHKPAVSMLNLMPTLTKGPPTRRLRWCCELYKEYGGKGLVKVAGVRAEESARRKAMWRVWTPIAKTDSYMLNPILYWTDKDVWGYLKHNKVPYSSLYDEGFSRLGCIGCPLNNKSRTADFERWPKYKLAWKSAIAKSYSFLHGKQTNNEHWSPAPESMADCDLMPGERFEDRLQDCGEKNGVKIQRVIRGFINRRRWLDMPNSTVKSGEDFYNWWMEENQPEAEDDCQMGLF